MRRNNTPGWNGNKVRQARTHWLARLPLPCSRCGRPVLPTDQWHVDHIHQRVLGGADGVENQWPAHASCNTSDGGKLGAARANERRATTARRPNLSEQSRNIRGV